MRALAIIGALAGLAGAAQALELALPGTAIMTGEAHQDHADLSLAVGPWLGGEMRRLAVSGQLTRQAWKIGASALSTAQILTPLESQLAQGGFVPLYRCDQDQCGGFDFRFATLGLPEPQMHVDLGEYHYLAMHRPDAEEYVSLMVSRSPWAGYVELTHLRPPPRGDEAEPPQIEITPASPAIEGATPGSLRAGLAQIGRAVLGDLVFETGSSDLGAGPFASLAELAGVMSEDRSLQVALVGHTDAEGALAGNIALSKRRAASVRARLIADFGIDGARLEAEGVGYLSPIAPNHTEEGRMINRRVEAVIVSTP